MNNNIIEMNQVHKSYKKIEALAALDLQVPAGSIYGFLGPNGAGKTTAIKLLMGMLRIDRGEARIFGLPVSDSANSVKIRKRIGFVAEDKELYPYMTVEQIIRFTRSFYPGWRADLEKRYLKMFDLPLDRKMPKLSKGMRSKLMLLLAMARGAELLMLDEPMEEPQFSISQARFWPLSPVEYGFILWPPFYQPS
jgi:ABC-2 type transport system ATP-binding protein